jgi:hypothetical protein
VYEGVIAHRAKITENGLRRGVIGRDIPEGDFSDAVSRGPINQDSISYDFWRVREEDG